tara:strand:- start:1569 stop:1685 length:117 start_codon:yes stop_codon:yes gene_type:complete
MKTRYVWKTHGLTFKTLKAARAFCRAFGGVNVIARIKA